jgi:thioredoxin reductase
MKDEIKVDKAELIPEVQKMLGQNARFGTATCLDLGDKFEVIYHFEQSLDLVNIRVQVDKNDSLPSISNIYLCAALIENEMRELFGINIGGIALDYKGGLLLGKESPKTTLVKPFPPVVKPLVPIRAQCSKACPAGVDVPRYVRLIGEGKFDQALAVIKQDNPFPGVCGRVCFAPCEEACRQGKQGEPIAIRLLKRFVYEEASYKEAVTAKPTGKRIAIIGSGPAGLTAAYFLAKLGHQDIIFEALPEPGGMMRVGIPQARLPRDVLNQEIDNVRNLGVEIRTNFRIDSLDHLFEQGYQAILVATGAIRERGGKLAFINEILKISKQLGLLMKGIDKGEVLEVDPHTLATSRGKVFAAGDVITGQVSVISAIGLGKRAAMSIDRYLGGKGVLKTEEIRTEEPTSRHTFIERREGGKRPRVEKGKGLTKEQAIAEGKRCWRCDLEE